MNTMNNLKSTLNTVAKQILDEYRKQYPSDLTKSAQANVVEMDGKYYIQLELASYWKFVEFGRKPGKFPPQGAILKWMKKESIIPRGTKGNIPSKKSLAFLIGRKIAKDGIEGKYPLQKTMDNLDNIGDKLAEAAMNDIIIKLKQDLDVMFD